VIAGHHHEVEITAAWPIELGECVVEVGEVCACKPEVAALASRRASARDRRRRLVLSARSSA
jgi:hypothetical protein